MCAKDAVRVSGGDGRIEDGAQQLAVIGHRQ
jgi:hypothetical protein